MTSVKPATSAGNNKRSVSTPWSCRTHEKLHGGRSVRYVRGPGPPEPLFEASSGCDRAGAHEDMLTRFSTWAGAQLRPCVTSSRCQTSQIHSWLQVELNDRLSSDVKIDYYRAATIAFRSKKHMVLVSDKLAFKNILVPVIIFSLLLWQPSTSHVLAQPVDNHLSIL